MANAMEIEKERGQEVLPEQEWSRVPMAGEKPKPPSFVQRTMKTLYGDIPAEELKRVAMLSGTLFFIIGGYWLLRSLKDPVLATLVGIDYIPTAKMLSLVVVFSLVFVYNKAVDVFPKHKLFYILGSTYALVFLSIAVGLASPSMGVDNTEASPDRYLGWISYFAIESFGSIGVSLFWAFVNSSVNLEGAKSAFGLIIAGAQVGSILGPTLVRVGAQSMGVPLLYACGALCQVAMVMMVAWYVRRFGVLQEDQDKADAAAHAEATGKKKPTKKAAGLTEGIVLILKHPYVLGIVMISCLFMVEVTILDFQLKKLARAEFPNDTRALSSFMGKFGQYTNGLSFFFSLLGTSYIVRRFGLRSSLVAFPTLCLSVIGFVYMSPTLMVVFYAMMALKALSYALNNPCKEMLYQPTSSAVKFKSKGWADIFGARGAKALGSVFNNMFKGSMHDLFTFGSLVSAFCSMGLLLIAIAMGKEFEVLQESGRIIGEDGSVEGGVPRPDESTSCAEEEEAAAAQGDGEGAEGGEEGSEVHI